MSQNLGTLKVYDDAFFGGKKVEYRSSGGVAVVVADHMIMSATHPVSLLKSVARDLASHFEKDILQQLLAHYAPQPDTGVTLPEKVKQSLSKGLLNSETAKELFAGSWNDPATDVVASMKSWTKQHYVDIMGTAKKTSQKADVLSTLVKAIPALKSATASCPGSPACGEGPYKDTLVTNVIIHLNDRHKWTREQIADWLETLDHDLSFQEAPEQPQMEGHQAVLAVQDEVSDFNFLSHFPPLPPIINEPGAVFKGISEV